MQKSHEVEPVTINEIVGLASWDRERTDEELQAFIERRNAAVGENFEEDAFAL